MKLKDYLIKNKLSKRGFARKSGISEVMVHRYTSERFKPLLEAARKIHIATKGAVTYEDFLDEADRIFESK